MDCYNANKIMFIKSVNGMGKFLYIFKVQMQNT